MAISAELERLISRWLPRQAWYPRFESEFGADSDVTPQGAVTVFTDEGEDARGPWTVRGVVVMLAAGHEGTLRRVQVPLTLRTREVFEQRAALLGEVDDIGLGHAFVYDGAADPLFSVRLAEFLISDDSVEGDQLLADRVRDPRSLPGDEEAVTLAEPASPDELPHVEVLSGGRTTSSAVVDLPGGPYLLKYFRVYSPGENTAVTVPAALTERGSDTVPAVVGSLRGTWFDADDLKAHVAHLALLSRFLPDSQEAWREAVASVVEVTDEEPGTYTFEARELGEQVGELHADLAGEFGSSDSSGDATVAQIATWRKRVDWALARAPLALAPLASHLRQYSKELADLRSIGPLQRIHGDLTLNHVLSSESQGYRVTNFATEPVRTGRRAIGTAPSFAASSPAQDLVSLVRSFDYAAGYARLQRLDALGADAGSAAGIGGLGSDLQDVVASPEFRWSALASSALLTGYSNALETSVDYDHPVFRAYLVDRLLTEVVTELRNRPAWLVIPLVTLTLLLEGRTDELTGTAPAVDALGADEHGADEHGDDVPGDGASGDGAHDDTSRGDARVENGADGDDAAADTQDGGVGNDAQTVPGGQPSGPLHSKESSEGE